MDVAKYIGLFLLKNNFCYIHGLGNLELKKKPASYNGDALLPPSYDVVLSPAGSIDDNLANFVATNEQISISKAANALRDFSTQARADLNAGKDVVIPAIGRFYEEESKVKFEADPNLKYTPPAIPTIKRAKHLEPQPAAQTAAPPPPQPVTAKENTRSYVPVHTPVEEEEDDEPGGLNWPRIILAAIVLLALVAILTFAYKKYNTSDDTLQPVLPTKDNTQQVTPAVPDTVPTAATAPGNVTMQGGLLHFKAIIDSYSSLKKAEKRVQQMRSYGHSVDLIVEDSTTYYVVMPISCAPADTTRVLDSLGVLFNPGNVVIY